MKIKLSLGLKGGGDRPASRIDTFYITKRGLSLIKNSPTYENNFNLSDHLPCIINLTMSKSMIGYDFWKNKPFIYNHEDFKKEFIKTWGEQMEDFHAEIAAKIKYRTFRGWRHELVEMMKEKDWISKEPFIKNLTLDCKWWEGFKSKIIRNISFIQKSYNIKKKRDFELLRKDYARTDPGPTRDRICKKMEDLIKNDRKNDLYKMQAEERIAHERCDGAFFQKVKQIHEGHFVDKFKDENGRILRTRENIHKSLNKQYLNLYALKNSNENHFNTFLNENLPKIKNENTEPFTLEEYKKAVASMGEKKCPGLDGIRIEFYKNTTNEIGPFFVEFINNCIKNNTFPDSWGESALQLVPKLKEGILSFENLRPLTMLMVDYKIFAKMVCNRILECTPDIINEHQTGGVSNAAIQNNTMLIHLLIQYYTYGTRQGEFEGDSIRQGYIVSLDNRKAFDNVIREYLWKVLKHFGFSDFLIDILKGIYSNGTTKILLNGFLGQSFPVMGGVRQGCPLSATLYTIFIEPLARAIMRCRNIAGFHLPDATEIKMIQHSDDMTLLLDSRWAIQSAMSLVNKYTPLSGAEINHKKSFIIHVKSGQIDEGEINGIKILRKDECKKILGIYFCNDISAYVRENWKNGLEKCKKALSLWNSSGLSLVGRALVINTMALSTIVYMTQTIEYNRTYAILIDKEVTKFLWDRKVVKRDLDKNKFAKNKGGLGIVDLKLKCRALHIKRFKNFLERPEDKDKFQCKISTILSFFLDNHLNQNIASPLYRQLKRMNIASTTLNLHDIEHKDHYINFFYTNLSTLVNLNRAKPHLNIFSMTSRWCYKYSMDQYYEDYRGEGKNIFNDNYVYDEGFAQREEILNGTHTIIDTKKQERTWMTRIFAPEIDPKIQSFNFLLIYGILPTKSKVFYAQQGTNLNRPTFINPYCNFCLRENDRELETPEHIFWTCPWTAENVWYNVNSHLIDVGLPMIDLQHFYTFFRQQITNYENILISEIFFILWKNRNKMLNNSEDLGPIGILEAVKKRLSLMSKIDLKRFGSKKYNQKWGKINRLLNQW